MDAQPVPWSFIILVQLCIEQLAGRGRIAIEELIAGLQYIVDELEDEIARRESASEGQDDNEEGSDNFA